MTTLAEQILNKISEASVDDLGEIPKKPLAVIENLGKNSFGASNADQKKMVEGLSKLAEMDDKAANKFMKDVDEACTKIYEGMKPAKKK
ncbi:hypothetical protein KAR91_85985 [Candidatus Pacearchaeota archaeon]|nr:hypothetical protein [Candidatus Pacearchaeota archaeon]